nr:49K [Neodiprion sertifer nucleopolyhedrovirus]
MNDNDIIFFHTYFKFHEKIDTPSTNEKTNNFIEKWRSGIFSELQSLDQVAVNKYIDYVNSLNLTNFKPIAKPFIPNKMRIEQVIQYKPYSRLFIENSLSIQSGISIFCTNCYVENETILKKVTNELYMRFRQKHSENSHNFSHAAVSNGVFGYVFESPKLDWKSENVCVSRNEYPKRLYLFGNNVTNFFETYIERLQNDIRYKNVYGDILLKKKDFDRSMSKKFTAKTVTDLRNIITREIGNTNANIILIQRDYIFTIGNITDNLLKLLDNYYSTTSLNYAITQYGNDFETITNTFCVDRTTQNTVSVNRIIPPMDVIPLHSYHILLQPEFGLQISGLSNAFLSPTYGLCLILARQIFGSEKTVDFDKSFILYQNTLRQYASTLIYHIIQDLYLIRFTTKIDTVIYIMVRCSSAQVKTEPIVNFDNAMIKNSIIFILHKYL